MKKLILSIMLSVVGMISFSTNITGGKYRVEGALGFISTKQESKFENIRYTSGSISILPEFKAQINKKIDITFEYKVTVNIDFHSYQSKSKIRPSVILGGEVDFNYKLKDNIKIYTGIEIGTGVAIHMNYIPLDKRVSNNNNSPLELKRTELATIGKMSLGVKIKDKFNVALYTGNTKGVLGIELGYTF
ncbi:hypothetical protein KX935_08090 [Streptobacillus moniliformis]|nr:hypothetical protein KX935_08090 [Streptobacillus moniliformis]